MAWAAASLPPHSATATRQDATEAMRAAVAALPQRPDFVLVEAASRLDLGVPTIGVTQRAPNATGEAPEQLRGARTPLYVNGEHVGAWLRIQPTARPIAVWSPDPQAVELVMSVSRKVRTPEPLRQARRLARLERARAQAAG